jgi:hypothetical protein
VRPPAPPPADKEKHDEVRTRREDDEAMLRDLDVIENLELLENLELFDKSGE